MAEQRTLFPTEEPQNATEQPRKRRSKPKSPPTPRLLLGAFLTDYVPTRRRSRKGSEIARHMLPLSRQPGVEEELQGLLNAWVEACDREFGDQRERRIDEEGEAS